MTRYYSYEEHIHRPSRHDSEERRSPSPSGSRRRHDSRDSFVRETMTLEPPPRSASRPRSVPPPETSSRDVIRRGRSPSPRGRRHYDDYDDYDRRSDSTISISRSRSRGRGRDDSPMSRARSALEDNFTNSTAGVGASLIGAIAGGYAARQVSDRVSENRHSRDPRRRRRRSSGDKDDKIRLASTILGAAIGGLGANALTNRFEDSRERTRDRQSAWEDKYGREENLPHYDSGRRDDLNHRNGRGALKSRDSFDDYDDYDHVYDRRDDGRRRLPRQESDESYRHYDRY